LRDDERGGHPALEGKCVEILSLKANIVKRASRGENNETQTEAILGRAVAGMRFIR
jgi:hypothetical protein